MRVSVDNTTCVGSGRCLRASEEVFDLGDDGFVELRTSQPPAELAKQVREAATYCPSQSITVED